jgi:hypothetical protein
VAKTTKDISCLPRNYVPLPPCDRERGERIDQAVFIQTACLLMLPRPLFMTPIPALLTSKSIRPYSFLSCK